MKFPETIDQNGCSIFLPVGLAELDAAVGRSFQHFALAILDDDLAQPRPAKPRRPKNDYSQPIDPPKPHQAKRRRPRKKNTILFHDLPIDRQLELRQLIHKFRQTVRAGREETRRARQELREAA